MTTPQWAITRIKDAQARRSTELNLSSNYNSEEYLKEIPDEVFRMPRLERLDLTGNQITQLPESLMKLENLKALVLNRNNGLSLSSWIAELQNLMWLGLSGIGLTKLPGFVTQCGKLIELNLGENKLTDLPSSLINLQNLNRLNLRENLLEVLPESVTNLKHLEYLNLSKNKIVTLPDLIQKLQNLRQLILSENQIVNLPESITRLKDTTYISLSGNPLVSPPPEVMDKGLPAVRDYFRQLQEQGQDQLYEAKLLILGEGGAGKTTFANKIKDPNYELKDEDTTRGVNVINWSFAMSRDKIFRVNIWDFGGQEIYHATHQFFLTKRSLYVLVADTRKEDTDFYYWLNVAELLSDNSPLLIVNNEKQDRKKEINERQLKGQFNNIKEVLSTNLATNRGLDKVRGEVEHYLKQLSHIGSPLPRTWVRVRETLESDSRNYISFDEYIALCKKNRFADIKDSLQLSEYLNDIGVFLHFQDDSLLRKTIILKPKWGTDAAYKILDNEKVRSNYGRFSRADIESIWGEPEYENMRDELLRLMMKFKLCYEIPNQRGMYIAPQLLTNNQPAYDWNEEENLLLRYSYKVFMPKGILSQLIVKRHKDIWDQKYVWKSGVVLEKNKTFAEIIEHYGTREIHIRVSGVHKRDLLVTVMDDLDEIHESFRRLKYDKLIPCNCKVCKHNQSPHFYLHEQLMSFIEQQIDKIQCGKTGEMVQVRGLIDDIIGWKSPKEVEELMAKKRQLQQGNINIGDNFSGNVIVGSNVENSFNELHDTLDELSQAVEAMKKELPKDKAEEVSEDLKMLVEQAGKEKPNPKWYNVSIDGLIKAAENLGKVGEPVVELSKKVLSLLTMGVIK